VPSSTTDAEIAVAVAVAVALGSAGAKLARASRDLDAVQAGLKKAKENYRAAIVAFAAVGVVVWVVVNWWIHAKH
jgi:hypothetical protein